MLANFEVKGDYGSAGATSSHHHHRILTRQSHEHLSLPTFPLPSALRPSPPFPCPTVPSPPAIVKQSATLNVKPGKVADLEAEAKRDYGT